MSKSSDSFRIARAAGSKKETPNRRRPAFGIGMLHVLLIVTLLTPYFLLLAGTIQASGKTPADLQGPEVPAGADPVPRPIDGRTVPGLSAAEPIEADPIPTAIPGGPRPYQLPDIRVETGPEPGRPSVASDPVEQFEIGPEGGSVSARNGKLRIWFPAGAVTETILVRVSDPPGVSGPPYSLSGQPFRIQAESMATGKRVDQFLQPLTIQLAYDERQVQGDEHWLTMYYWDRRRPGWVPLASQVDTQADIVSGMTDHFTDFDIEVQSWQSRNLPTLQAFQGLEFSGAAVYSRSLWVPPGPAGLQPQLRLSYNSQVADSARLDTQAGWVGMGWSLEVGSIQRHMKGTNDFLADDVFSLHLSEFSSLLAQIAQDVDGVPTTTDYRTSADSFWRVRYFHDDYAGSIASPDSWLVWDKQGNVYSFGEQPDDRARYPTIVNQCAAVEYQTWRWGISRMTNLSGQSLTFAHGTDIPRAQARLCGQKYEVDSSLYPKEIRYPHDRYRVVFVRGPRKDYDRSIQVDNLAHLFERSFLDRIQIQHDTNGAASGGWQTVRVHELEYAADASQAIFPNILWEETDLQSFTLTLGSIQEIGVNGGTQTFLPPTTFVYDGAHLEIASNGYGGQVQYLYDQWFDNQVNLKTNPNALSGRKLVQDFTGPGLCGQVQPSTGGWSQLNGSQSRTYCNRDDYLQVEAVTARRDFDLHLQQPGAVYILRARVKTDRNAEIQLGIRDRGASTNYYGSAETFKKWDWYETAITLPNDSTRDLELRIKCTRGDCQISDYLLFLAPTRYRVATRTLFTGSSFGPYTFGYCYTDHSDAGDAATCQSGGTDQARTSWPSLRIDPGSNPYMENYSEFRGHATVAEYAPGNRKTVRSFCQDDYCKGRLVMMETYDTSGVLYEKLTFDYPSTPLSLSEYSTHTVQRPQDPDPPPGDAQFTGFEVYWVRPDSQTTSTCQGVGNCAIRRSVFAYDPNQQDGAQHGNLTQTRRQEWVGGAWDDYRLTLTVYYPATSSHRYLVGLPAAVSEFACPGSGSCGTSHGLASVHYLYDSNSRYDRRPNQGLLTKIRVWMDSNGSGTDPNRFSQVEYRYDAWGNANTIKTYAGYGQFDGSPPDPGRTTVNTYDALYGTYLERTDPPLIGPTLFDYNPRTGMLQSVTDPNGNQTTAFYDDFGRPLHIVRPGDSSASPTIRFSYNDANRLQVSRFETAATQKIDSSEQLTVHRYYDGIGNLLQIETDNADVAAGTRDILVDFFYDAAGRPWRQSIPYAVAPGSGYRNPLTRPFTEQRYDALGRVTRVIATDGAETSYAYGLLETSVTDARGSSTTTHFDVWGRVVEVHPPLDPWTKYGYDPLDRLTSVDLMDGNSSHGRSEFSYDPAGRKTQMSDGDLGLWEYAYDGLSNLVAQTDARGCRIDFSYDDLNRLTGKTYSGSPASCDDTPDVTFGYDGTGNGNHGVGMRTRMEDGSGSTSWEYDLRGRMVQETRTYSGYQAPLITTLSYNQADKLVAMTYPDGEIVRYEYHPQGPLDRMTTSAAESIYIAGTSYDPAGRMDLRVLGANQLKLDHVYYDWSTPNGGGRLKEILAGKYNSVPSSPSLMKLSLRYDAVGNVKTIRDAINGDQTQCFTYDRLDRLTKATTYADGGQGCSAGQGLGNYDQAYSYDSSTGNLTNKTGLGAYSYNAQVSCPAGTRTLLHAVSAAGSFQYGYDCNGSMTERITGNGTYKLTYDAENRLTAVSGPGGVHHYVYDGDGGRVGKSDPHGNQTFFVGSHFEVFLGDAPPATPSPTAPPVQTPTPTGAPTPTPGPTATPGGPYCLAIPGPGFQIPDNDSQGLTVEIRVPDDLPIADLDVQLGSNHTYVGQLIFNLSHLETGSSATLIDQPGRPATRRGCSEAGISATLDDDATAWAEDTCNPEYPALGGVLKPNSSLVVFNGESMSGTWQLNVVDRRKGKTGRLDAFCLYPRLGYSQVGQESQLLAGLGGTTHRGTGRAPIGFLQFLSSLLDGRPPMGANAAQASAASSSPGHSLRAAPGEVWTSYYLAGQERVALRVQDVAGGTSEFYYLFSDHIGSASVVARLAGSPVSRIGYLPWGEVRYQEGSLPTRYTFTGQYSEMENVALLFYGSRWYDPQIGRFIQADTFVPDLESPADWDRYSYVVNNPLKLIDPGGQFYECPPNDYACQIAAELEQAEAEKRVPEPDPLCQTQAQQCTTLLERSMTAEQLDEWIDAYSDLLYTLKTTQLTWGVAGGIAALGVGLIGTPVAAAAWAGFVLLTEAELTYEALTIETTIQYLEDARSTAEQQTAIGITLYLDPEILAGLFPVLYYEGADKLQVLAAPLTALIHYPLLTVPGIR